MSLAAATAASIPGLTSSNVRNITISSGGLSRRRLQISLDASPSTSSSGSTLVNFTVITNNAELTYSFLESTLTSSIASGFFSQNLHKLSLQYGAAGLVHANATLIGTENLASGLNSNPVTPPQPSTRAGLSTAITVVISVLCILVAGAIGLLIFIRRKRLRSGGFRDSRFSVEADTVARGNKNQQKSAFYMQDNPLQSIETGSNSTFGTMDFTEESRL
jgi:hypothetical protein